MNIPELISQTQSFLSERVTDNKSTALVLASDISYFNYELVTLSNLKSVIHNPEVTIFVIHGEGITFDHADLLAKLYPDVIQIFAEDLPVIRELQHFFNGTRWGSSLALKLVPLLLSEHYATTIGLDVDILLLKDFTYELSSLSKHADLLCRLADASYSANRLLPVLNASSLKFDALKKSWRSPMAGVLCISQSFTQKVTLSEIFTHIYSVSKELFHHSYSATEEAVIGTYLPFSPLIVKDLPVKYHHLMHDFMPYAINKIPDHDIFLIHFKFWDSAEYLNIFPQYLEHVQNTLSRLESIPESDKNSVALTYALATLKKIVSLNSKNTYASRVCSLQLLQTYQELLPCLITLLSHSKYFEMQQTLSTDRLILWSKFNPRCFRCDIASIKFARSPIDTENTSVLRFNPTPIYFVIRYAVLGSNSDNLDLTHSAHVNLFKQLQEYFALSELSCKPWLLSLKIRTTTEELPVIFRKLEWFIDAHQEEFMKI